MRMWQNVNYRGDESELLLCEMIRSIIALNLCSIFCDGKVPFLFKYKFHFSSHLPYSVTGKSFSKIIMD